jgi:hypothetical protein
MSVSDKYNREIIMRSNFKAFAIKSAAGAALAGAILAPFDSALATVTISGAATKNMACVGGVCTPTEKSAVLNATDLQTMLASGNVTVTTADALASDIVIASAVTWVSTNTLTLNAHRFITVNKPVTITGTGGLTLDVGGGDNALSFGDTGNIAFWDLASSLSINAKSYTLVNSVAMLASDITAKPKGYFALAANYNASVDGTYQSSPIATQFNGQFEGLGNTISNLSISDSNVNEQYEGLFSFIGKNGRLRNIELSNANVSDVAAYFKSVGAIAGENEGSIAGVHVSGTISAPVATTDSITLGAVAGVNGGTIFKSYADATVSGSESGGRFVGNLVGLNSGIVRNSGAAGSVSGSNENVVGGLVGWVSFSSVIFNSYSTAAVTGGASVIVGGLAGVSEGWIQGSYASGPVTGGDASRAGGLVGTVVGTIRDCYAIGSVVGGNSATVGGLFGQSGMILAQFGPAYADVSNSYATGSVIKGRKGGDVGGFTGVDNDVGTILTSYWDKSSSGILKGTGNRGNEPGITGLTTTQLQSGLPAGFDPSIWGENPGINGGLPYLLELPPT